MNYTSKTTKPGAWICTNKKEQKNRGRVKTHQPGSKIYLKDSEEFEIELFNPTTFNLKASIHLDNKFIGHSIIIKPGERIYLDCFPDSKKKFTFKTYEVEDTEESENAVRMNGDVKVIFYKESTTTDYNPRRVTWINYPYYQQYPYYIGNGNTTLGNNTLFNSNTTTLTNNSNYFSTTSIETGQVEGGEKSNQEFDSIEMYFDNNKFETISFKILPYSRKPLTKKDVMGKKDKKSKVNLNINDYDLDRLMKLSDLYSKGHLTSVEFQLLKSNLIK